MLIGPDRKSQVESHALTMRKRLAGPVLDQRPPQLPIGCLVAIVIVLIAITLALVIWPGLAQI
ncbi:MAG: hypothetical protein ACREQ5_40095 [Candidatus Dormibacteria bacterium]